MRALSTLFLSFSLPLLLLVPAAVGCSAELDPEELGAVGSALTLEAESPGPIRPGEVRTDSYAGGKPNRAFSFNAKGSDTVAATISIDGGDAIGFITDAGLSPVASNDNAAPGTLDAVVVYRVPEGQPNTPFQIAFRNKSAPSGTFHVKLDKCNQADEPWRRYLFEPKDCEFGHFACNAPETRFVNFCGCGCERPH